MTERSLIGEHFCKHYRAHYARNNSRHREEHCQQVSELALAIREELCIGVSPMLVELAAWSHDLFHYHRETHHLEAALWVHETDDALITALSPGDRLLLSRANAEHRSSFKCAYTSPLSELLATANLPFDDVDTLIKHAYIKGLRKEKPEDVSLLEAINDDPLSSKVFRQAIEHVVAKYKRGGYARYPAMFVTYYQAQLDQRYDIIGALESITYPSQYTMFHLFHCTCQRELKATMGIVLPTPLLPKKDI